ncbi:MAG: hypothetical protein AB1846_19925 [Chloroflexota bacterium]
MLVLITFLLLLVTAASIAILHFARPDRPYSWLIASGGAFMAWISVFFWQLDMPARLSLPAWEPQSLFTASPSLLVDGLSWPYALSLVTLTLALMLTSIIRKPFPDMLAWAGTLAMTAMGLIAVLADNPLTLVLGWAAIDIVELTTTLRSVNGAEVSEKAVIAFAIRITGLGIVLWASMASLSAGIPLDFETPPAQVGLYLLVAAGLRLGVLPLHLPYTNEPALRRGFGTMLRLVSAASSLVLLARVQLGSVDSPVTPVLLWLTAIAALFGGWQWLRASDELTGRPFWVIGMGSLAVGAALNANPVGSVAWGAALILASSVLFLYSVRQTWLTRLLMPTLVGLSALPFTPAAAGWIPNSSREVSWLFWLAFIPTQAMLMAGFVRHIRQPSVTSLTSQPRWTQVIYPTGLLLPILVHLALALWGWDGALNAGNWWVGTAASGLALALYWLGRKTSLLTPRQAHWVRPGTATILDRFYGSFWGLYRLLGRASAALANALEGDGGMVWIILVLVLFISLLRQAGG